MEENRQQNYDLVIELIKDRLDRCRSDEGDAIYSELLKAIKKLPQQVLKPEHKCVQIAQAQMSEGRDWWLGKLAETVSEFPQETHCLHLKTPLKDVVFLCNAGDFQQLSVLCRHALGYPISESWMQAQLQITNRTGEPIAALTNRQQDGWSDEDAFKIL